MILPRVIVGFIHLGTQPSHCISHLKKEARGFINTKTAPLKNEGRLVYSKPLLNLLLLGGRAHQSSVLLGQRTAGHKHVPLDGFLQGHIISLLDAAV